MHVDDDQAIREELAAVLGEDPAVDISVAEVPDVRAEELTPADFLELARALR